jgi:hypothetical protein
VSRLFTVDEARGLVAELRPALDDFITLRAEAAEIGLALATGETSPLGGRAELKAAEARCNQTLADLVEAGVQVKGVAPLLLDLPCLLDGVEVLLCWLEGDSGLEWYHRTEVGFAGRRRLP